MAKRNMHICPVELAGSLDGSFRRWMHNPEKILRGQVTSGMRVLDIGCGPGFFTLPLARMVGEKGSVVAVDLQEGMLRIVERKIAGQELARRIVLHRCGNERLGLRGKADFALAFYTAHEVADQEAFFKDLADAVKPGGRLLLVEPWFHVTKKAFKKTLAIAESAGWKRVRKERVFFSRAVVLER